MRRVVPCVLVAGRVAIFAELPAPLGSLPELLRPAALAGPDGTPLTPCVPARAGRRRSVLTGAMTTSIVQAPRMSATERWNHGFFATPGNKQR